MPILDPNASPQRLPNALVNVPVLPEMLGAQEAAPDLGADPQPDVRRAPSPLEQNIANHQQQLQKVQWAQANPWGTANNHPGAIGKIAHVLSVAGNIAGNIVAPNIMANIPGTQLNRQAQGSALARELDQESNQESEEQGRNTQTAKIQAETSGLPQEQADKHALDTAQTAHLNAETDAAKNPAPQYEYQQTDHGLLRIDKKTGLAQPVTLNGVPIGPKQQTKTVQLEVGGRPHQVLVNEATGEQVKDLGESGEKPPTVNVNAGTAALDRETSRFAKPYEKGVSDANAQLEKIQDARAMINGSAESQALGIPKVLTALVSGAGSGVRITQAELNAIARARGIQGSAEGFLNNLSGKGQLSHDQQKQLTGLLDDVQARILQKQSIHNETLDKINGAGSREDVIKADREARQRLAQLEQGGGQNNGGGVIRARDPQGKLHEAPAGTPLPKGWKLDGQ